MRRVNVGVLLLLVSARVALSQSPSPRFEIVSVKENQAVGRAGIDSGPNQPGKYSFINLPLATIISTAFNLKDYEIVGLPNWTRTTKYDVIGTYPEGANPQVQSRQMIQNMLAERFGFKAHRELMDRTVYRLVVAREDRALGPMLIPSDVDCDRWRAENRPQIGAAGSSVVSPSGKRDACMMAGQRNWIVGATQPISRLAWYLENRLGTRVLDHTGLTGNFNIDLAWTPEQDIDAQGPGAPANPSAPLSGNIFTAVQEQLGLKLEPSKEKVDTLIVDAVSRPTPD